ncbi:MAG: ATP-binding protein [Thioalkalispiraceae bacterium]
MAQLTVNADLDNLHQARDFVDKSLRDEGASKSEISDFVLAVDEALTNIIQHGYRNQAGNIVLDITSTPGEYIITITDSAPTFHRTSITDPDLQTSPDERNNPGGFGLYLIEKMVDKATYSTLQDGHNQLQLIKHRTASQTTRLSN